MKKLVALLSIYFFYLSVFAQRPLIPDKIYGQLFHDVQIAKIFLDGKTFVDCVPKKDPAIIVAEYVKLKNNPAVRYSLKLFVEENFIVPSSPRTIIKATGMKMRLHI